MRNLFDFSDAQLSWRSCREFILNPNTSSSCQTIDGADDEESWFFNYPKAISQEKADDSFNLHKEMMFKPEPHIITFRRWRQNPAGSWNPSEVRVALDEFRNYEEFMEFAKVYICIPNYFVKVVSVENCDPSDASSILTDPQAFEDCMMKYNDWR